MPERSAEHRPSCRDGIERKGRVAGGNGALFGVPIEQSGRREVGARGAERTRPLEVSPGLPFELGTSEDWPSQRRATKDARKGSRSASGHETEKRS